MNFNRFILIFSFFIFKEENVGRDVFCAQCLPGEMPTILLLRAAGVIPTIDPPDWPSIRTTSLPSRPSGVVDESTVKSHFPSFPATDLKIFKRFSNYFLLFNK